MSDSALHLDQDALVELKQVMGDEFPLLIDTFTSDSIVRIETITAAVNASAPEEIRRAAHSFKGSAGNMGATQLAALCKKLEDLGAEGKADGSQDLLAQITAEYDHVKAALESL